MQDKEIRKILIEYLKIQHEDHRIYQEKNIGTAVCDVMLVTDHLSGFEIKSDCDNYERLPRQVHAYDLMFDKNYIAIGVSHINSIKTEVPTHWGILAVDSSGIRSIREAKRNKSVKRTHQLNLLWKLELKNLLLKNQLPVYAQKSKAFLRDVISREVPTDTLGPQIATELLNRDESLFDEAEAKTADNAEGYLEKELADYLSEEDLESFTLDKWMAVYRRAVDTRIRKKAREQQITQEHRDSQRAAHTISYTDIKASLGVPWVSAEIISQFAIEVLNVKQQYYYRRDEILGKSVPYKKVPIVQYEKITGYWHVEKYKKQQSPEFTMKYGTARYNAMQILESTLNLRQIRVYDGNAYNEAETLAVLEKQKALQDAFEQWVWRDEDRRWEIEDAYNRLFAEYKVHTFDGSKLKFPGMNPEIKLYDYQKDAVQKIISTPNTLLSFDVGSGKTYIMIAAAMEMRKSGLSRKNIFVVPNNIVGQWEKMFCDLYPRAKVLAVEPKSFTPEKRGKVLAQMQKEDYDGIILAYSCFEMIPLSSKCLLRDMHKSLNQFELRLKELYSEGFSGALTSIRRESDYVQKTMQNLIGCVSGVSSEITFDDLGINTIFVDEAHNFKNIPLRTTMKHIRGINIAGSKKCLDMLKKVHFVQQSNGGRGAVFATGTPLCNSISDAYAMQCYLQYEDLQKKGLDRFDNWVKTFAHPEEICEIDVDTSGFRVVYRFKEFFNLTELSKMFGQISIFHSVDQIDLPELSGYTDVVISKSEALDAYMKGLYTRTEAIRAGDVDRKKDNMLKVSTDGRKAALSLELVGKEQSYDPKCKLWHCVQNILETYHRHDGCSQLVFCDYATPQNKQYSIYSAFGKSLEACGIPSKEIAFVHTYRTEEQKLKLYDAVNSGKIRVLIGSTFKLGIGANVQTKLKAIHHLDVPWRPADMVQREGRILRRGNEYKNIFIFRYIAEGSFDSYSWQILQTKQHFISQFLSGSGTVRSLQDFENDELNYAQVKALALSEPLMKEYTEKENELRRARMVLQQEMEQKAEAKTQISVLEGQIKSLHQQLMQTEATALYVAEHIDLLYKEIVRAANWITSEDSGGEPYFLGEFTLQIRKASTEKIGAVLSRGGVNYTLDLGHSFAGNKTRFKNFFLKFPAQAENLRKQIEDMEARKNDLKQRMKYVSQSSDRITRLEQELNTIFVEISQKAD